MGVLNSVPNLPNEVTSWRQTCHRMSDRKTAHKTHTIDVFADLRVLCALCAISNLLIPQMAESFNSVPGHHCSRVRLRQTTESNSLKIVCNRLPAQQAFAPCERSRSFFDHQSRTDLPFKAEGFNTVQRPSHTRWHVYLVYLVGCILGSR
jgi:hypothetical protein